MTTATQQATPVLSVTGATKTFGAVAALDGAAAVRFACCPFEFVSSC